MLSRPADTATAKARVNELRKQPLAADSAVEVELLNNRGLQASFAALGIAESVHSGPRRRMVI